MTYPRRIVALDFETNGDIPAYDSIRQIGAAVMEDGTLVGEPFQSYMRVSDINKLKIRFGALAATCGDLGTPEGAAALNDWIKHTIESPTPPDVATEFVAWSVEHGARELPVVAHFAHFDHGFYGEWCKNNRYRMSPPPLGPVWICTWTMSRLRWPDEQKHYLDDVLERLGYPPRPKHHDALADALLAGAVYHRLTTDAQVTA